MGTVEIAPLGGVRENGKNTYVAEVEDEIFILDCGSRYPGNELLGIDVVIPDFIYLEKNSERIVGVFLTHGHADVVGALPYLLSKTQAPVFGTELATELARLSINSHAETRKFKDFHVIDLYVETDFGQATVSFFKATRTIPDSTGVGIKTRKGNIAYTGGFKFGQSAIEMYQTNYGRLAETEKEGALALPSDSSNAENLVQVASEAQIADEVFDTICYWEG